jgi:Tol biopolymer transport system component
VSDRTGNFELWTADPRGLDPRPVTSLKSGARHPRWAPDGRRLAFVGLKTGANNHDIYVVQASGGGMRRLTDEPSTDQWPTWSHDGKWIYFTSDRTGTWQIWKVADAGGPAVQVTTNGALKAWESRDGRFVLYSDETRGIWSMPVAGGASERLLDFPHSPTWGGEWVPADRGIFFLNVGGSRPATFELFDFSTRRVTPVLTVSGLYDGGSGFAISRDGTWLVYPQRDVARSEIMLIDLDR